MTDISDRWLVDVVAAARELASAPEMRDVVATRGPLGQPGVVTRADRAVDEYVRMRVADEVPHSTVVSEESADPDVTVPRHGLVFVLDPIDGSSEYAAGRSGYATSLAVVVDGRAVGAAVAFADDVLVAGATSAGTASGAKRIAVSPRQVDLLGRTPGWWSDYELTPIPTFSHKARALLLGDVAYALVAPYRHVMFVWDWLPMATIVAHAGGVLTAPRITSLSRHLAVCDRSGWYGTMKAKPDGDRARVEALASFGRSGVGRSAAPTDSRSRQIFATAADGAGLVASAIRLPMLPQQRRRLRIRASQGARGPSHTVVKALRFAARLDPERLQRAVDALVERHESLRIAFPAADRYATQLVRARASVPLETVRMFSSHDAVAELGQELEARPFSPDELASGRVMRIVLVDSRDGAAVLVAADHLVVDDVAMDILIRDLGRLYADGAAGCEQPAPSYRSYVEDEAAFLAGDAASELLARYAESVREVGPLPAAGGRLQHPRRSSGNDFRRYPWRLGAREFAEVRDRGGSRFVTLLASLAITLQSVDWEPPLGLVCVYANRDRRTAKLLHSLTSLVTLSIDSNPRWTFVRQTEHVGDVVVRGLELARIPQADLVRVMRPEWQAALPSHAFLLVNYGQARHGRVPFGEIVGEPVQFPVHGFDWLALQMAERPSVLDGSVAFDAAVVDQHAAREIALRLRRVVRSATGDPSRRVATLIADARSTVGGGASTGIPSFRNHSSAGGGKGVP